MTSTDLTVTPAAATSVKMAGSSLRAFSTTQVDAAVERLSLADP